MGLPLVGLADARRGRRGGRQRQDLDGQGRRRGGGPAGRPGPGGRPAGRPRPVPPPGSRAAGPLRRRPSRSRREFLDRVEPRIWTPGSSHGRRLSLDPIRLPGRDELARIADPDRREEEWQGMLGVAAAQLVGLAKVGGETDSQQTFLLQVLRSPGGRRARARREPRGRSPPRPPTPSRSAWTTRTSSSRSRSARSWRASSTACGSGRPRRSSPAGPGSTWTPCAGPTSPGKTPLNVIYLNALADDDQKHFFVAALAAEIYRWMITSLDAVPGRPSLLFYLDEARDYIPAGDGQAAGQGPADPAVHPGAQVRRRLPALHPEPALGRLQRLRQLQHQAGRPPGEPAGPGAGRRSGSRPRARHRPGSRAARGPRPAASSADGRRCPPRLEGRAVPQPAPVLAPRRGLVARSARARDDRRTRRQCRGEVVLSPLACNRSKPVSHERITVSTEPAPG